MYKNIIFDLGNVLLDFNPREYLKSKISEEKLEEVFKAIFNSEEWIMLDRGTITEKEAINNIISRNAKHINEINLAFENWYDILKPMEESIKILMDLKENGYKITAITDFKINEMKRLFLDIMMPKMKGPEVLANLKNINGFNTGR